MLIGHYGRYRDRTAEVGLHESNISLILLYPSSGLPSEFLFYKIFGDIPPATYELACLENWLGNMNNETIRTHKAVYNLIIRDLDRLVGALDKVAADPDSFLHTNENHGDYQRAMTVKDYAIKTGRELPYSELRRRFQSYRTLLENIKERRVLTRQEQEERKEFLEFVRFFSQLEEDYAQRLRFQDGGIYDSDDE